jgi:hypothetical protein
MCEVVFINTPKPVLRYFEQPDRTAKRSGSSEYLRTGLGI